MKRETLLKKFHRLEIAKKTLLDVLDKLNSQILYVKPAPDKWSIVQILYHLHVVELRSIGYVNKKILGGRSVPETGISAAVRSAFLKWLLLSGYKWKAPAGLGPLPEDLRYNEVLTDWDESRSQLKRMVEAMPENMFEREIYRHFIAGRLNLIQMLHFFQDHFDHHMKQVNKLIRTHSMSTAT